MCVLQHADLGFNELGFMNSTRGIHTPNLDTLARSGVILKNYCECMCARVQQCSDWCFAYCARMHDRCTPTSARFRPWPAPTAA